MIVAIETGPAFNTAKPRLLFEGRYEKGDRDFRSYDIAPDDQSFLLIKGSEEGAPKQLRTELAGRIGATGACREEPMTLKSGSRVGPYGIRSSPAPEERSVSGPTWKMGIIRAVWADGF